MRMLAGSRVRQRVTGVGIGGTSLIRMLRWNFIERRGKGNDDSNGSVREMLSDADRILWAIPERFMVF